MTPLEKKYSEELSKAVGRTLIVEHRSGYGWFIVQRVKGVETTLIGFHNKRLFVAYLQNVQARHQLYTPTVSETFGR